MTRLVVIESPFAGDLDRNVIYAQRALRDSIYRNEAPIASHLLYPQVLNECNEKERTLGINLGFEWWIAKPLIAIYIDYGVTPGMEKAIHLAKELKLDITEREIGENK